MWAGCCSAPVAGDALPHTGLPGFTPWLSFQSLLPASVYLGRQAGICHSYGDVAGIRASRPQLHPDMSVLGIWKLSQHMAGLLLLSVLHCYSDKQQQALTHMHMCTRTHTNCSVLWGQAA